MQRINNIPIYTRLNMSDIILINNIPVYTRLNMSDIILINNIPIYTRLNMSDNLNKQYKGKCVFHTVCPQSNLTQK